MGDLIDKFSDDLILKVYEYKNTPKGNAPYDTKSFYNKYPLLKEDVGLRPLILLLKDVANSEDPRVVQQVFRDLLCDR